MSDPVTYPNRAKTIRDRLFSLRLPENRPVDLALGDGETQKVWVRTPLIKDRDAIAQMAIASMPKVKGDDGKWEAPDLSNVPSDRMMAAALIVLVVDEVGSPVFEAVEFDNLRGFAIGGPVETLGMECVRALMPVKADSPKA
jgi:hypothetical protein